MYEMKLSRLTSVRRFIVLVEQETILSDENRIFYVAIRLNYLTAFLRQCDRGRLSTNLPVFFQSIISIRYKKIQEYVD